MTMLFWTSAYLLAHTYFIYPVTLLLLAWIGKREKPEGAAVSRKVSILISVYNEEKVIEAKIKNCLELDYPEEKLEIIFGSDCSTDNSNNILQQYSQEGKIKFIAFDKRIGKSAVLNRLIEKAEGEIVLFCDANTMLLKNTVQKLLSNFTDDSIGCVCGRLMLQDSSGSPLGRGESLYWKMESEIKKLEGGLGIVLGANGGIYAIRKELYTKIPEQKAVMDDFFITTQILAKGKKAVYEPLAIGNEETSVDSYGEFKRKVRIGLANFNLIFTYLRLLNPAYGMVAYSIFSHKLLRWIGPVLLQLLFISNLIMLFTHSTMLYYDITFILQCLFYTLAFIGYIRDKVNQKMGIMYTLPLYFTSMNIALFTGMLKAIIGQSGGMWERIERTSAS